MWWHQPISGVISDTNDLSLEHLILMIHAGLLYSWCFQLSSSESNPSWAGMPESQTQSQLEFGENFPRQSKNSVVDSDGIWKKSGLNDGDISCWDPEQITNPLVITASSF